MEPTEQDYRKARRIADWMAAVGFVTAVVGVAVTGSPYWFIALGLTVRWVILALARFGQARG